MRRALIVCSLLSCSCDSTTPAGACQTRADCGVGESCIDGRCVQPCNSDGDCQPAERCAEGYCQPVVLPECRADDQCATPGPCEHADGAVCRAGQCRYQAKLPNASCDDGNACTDADTCNAVRVCSGVARVCNTPPSSVCIADDTIFRTYSSPGACDPADGQCVYQFDDQGCAGCTVNCLYCDEHADCAPGGYCDADQQCTPRRADGGDCSGIGAEACVSRYCNGGLCCGHGDCCNNPGDCAPSYDGVSRCTDTTPATSCQGTRLERACEEHVCTSAPRMLE